MILDSQTLRDLEIFESQSDGRSLFELCNLTRTSGGARALRRRMENPWSEGDRIRSTQNALVHIHARREAFKDSPAVEYITNRVEHYQNGILHLITHSNALEFGIGVLLVRIYHDREYGDIARGVQITARFVRSLRSFVASEALASPAGELAGLLEEMQALLARPGLSAIPSKEPGSWRLWRVLRIDQVLRLHEKDTMDKLLQLTYELDALVALADATKRHGFVLPKVEQGPLRVKARELVHPLVPNAVPNAVELDQGKRLLFLTGPNMAGKTTYLRAFATALYMAHLGMGVPAESYSFVPVQYLFSSLAHRDDLQSGISYFRAEALRVRRIAEALASGSRVVAILDEPFKGTNVKDALDASFAILARLAAREDCLFIFASHLIELYDELGDVEQIECRCFEAEEGEERLRFEYLLRPGISKQRLGMRVLHEEGIFDLLDGTADTR